MHSNKIFTIKELSFNLPDDFNGTVTDALELIVKYRKSKLAINNRIVGPILKTEKEQLEGKPTIDQLLENNTNRLSFQIGIRFFENGIWVDKVEDERML